MRARGHVLLLMMTVLAAATIAIGMMGTRLEVNIAARRSTDIRLQALWLARSALAAGVTGTRSVRTAWGPAAVRVEKKKDGGVVAIAQLAGGRAEVARGQSGSWLESYAAAP